MRKANSIERHHHSHLLQTLRLEAHSMIKISHCSTIDIWYNILRLQDWKKIAFTFSLNPSAKYTDCRKSKFMAIFRGVRNRKSCRTVGRTTVCSQLGKQQQQFASGCDQINRCISQWKVPKFYYFRFDQICSRICLYASKHDWKPY